MNVITLASRKGGAGKSTLTAQLAAQAHTLGQARRSSSTPTRRARSRSGIRCARTGCRSSSRPSAGSSARSPSR